MKSVLISIQPKWCELIASGKKTIEVRKTAPKLETPFKCYIYEIKGLCSTPTFIDEYGYVSYRGRGAVIGEFVCDYIWDYYFWQKEDIDKDTIIDTCLSFDEIWNYGKGKTIYGWDISDLKIYDKPKGLGEFRISRNCKEKDCETCKRRRGEYICDKRLTRPFQSWGYVDAL